MYRDRCPVRFLVGIAFLDDVERTRRMDAERLNLRSVIFELHDTRSAIVCVIDWNSYLENQKIQICYSFILFLIFYRMLLFSQIFV
jgi:hypothetical protein